MKDYIILPRNETVVMTNPLTLELCIRLMSPEALDIIIEQCRDIKLNLLEEKHDQN